MAIKFKDHACTWNIKTPSYNAAVTPQRKTLEKEKDAMVCQ
jgi:hypothetical protein